MQRSATRQEPMFERPDIVAEEMPIADREGLTRHGNDAVRAIGSSDPVVSRQR